MGISRFYRNLSERYPLINNFLFDSFESNVDYFYVDLNGLIHVVAHNNSETNTNLPNIIIYERISHYITWLVECINPKKLLYIAIDGVAPLSKCKQQRIRRYTCDPGNTDSFNKNSISPGTDFILGLDQYLKTFFLKLLADGHYGFEIIFSPSVVPGEGEHKIVKHIRSTSDFHANIFIHGKDADFIILCLGLDKFTNLSLLRETTDFGFDNDFVDVFTRLKRVDYVNMTVLDISSLRAYLQADIGSEYLLNFVFASFLVGNDFLPSVPLNSVFDKGIENVIELLKGFRKSKLIGRDGYIRWPVAVEFFKSYVFNIERDRVLDDYQKGINGELYCQKLLKQNGSYVNDTTTYDDYYAAKHIDRSSAVVDFLRGLEFMGKYYLTLDHDTLWKWYYPHTHAPLVEDILAYLQNTTISPFLTVRTEPFTPIQQLLLILPPHDIRRLVKDEFIPENLLDSNKDLFPDEWDIDMSGKKVEFAGIPLLNIPNTKSLEYLKQSTVDWSTEEKIYKAYGIDYFFKYEKKTKSSFRGVVGLQTMNSKIVQKSTNSNQLRITMPQVYLGKVKVFPHCRPSFYKTLFTSLENAFSTKSTNRFKKGDIVISQLLGNSVKFEVLDPNVRDENLFDKICKIYQTDLYYSRGVDIYNLVSEWVKSPMRRLLKVESLPSPTMRISETIICPSFIFTKTNTNHKKKKRRMNVSIETEWTYHSHHSPILVNKHNNNNNNNNNNNCLSQLSIRPNCILYKYYYRKHHYSIKQDEWIPLKRLCKDFHINYKSFTSFFLKEYKVKTNPTNHDRKVPKEVSISLRLLIETSEYSPLSSIGVIVGFSGNMKHRKHPIYCAKGFVCIKNDHDVFVSQQCIGLVKSFFSEFHFLQDCLTQSKHHEDIQSFLSSLSTETLLSIRKYLINNIYPQIAYIAGGIYTTGLSVESKRFTSQNIKLPVVYSLRPNNRPPNISQNTTNDGVINKLRLGQKVILNDFSICPGKYACIYSIYYSLKLVDVIFDEDSPIAEGIDILDHVNEKVYRCRRLLRLVELSHLFIE